MINLFGIKFVFFEKWHGNIQFYKMSKPYAHFCNFESQFFFKKAHFRYCDLLEVKHSGGRFSSWCACIQLWLIIVWANCVCKR